MSPLADGLGFSDELAEPARRWLHDLIADWQMLSDLSFGDLVLWLDRGGQGWQAVAHVRPTTGVGIFLDDPVGRRPSDDQRQVLDQARHERRVVAQPRPAWHGETPVREEAIPVCCKGIDTPVAVMTRHTSHASMRTPSRLEVTYLATADALARMIAQGQFPTASGYTGRRRGAPRVGDGVVRLNAEGAVSYASPNAVSALHRLGHTAPVLGVRLAQALVDLVDGEGLDEEQVPVLAGQLPWATEVRTRSASVTVRSIPLSDDGQGTGALLLLRDVSELRRREQELLTKDATIREIHHRVKNNLQSVAAVLRLQARRVTDPEAHAALDGAVRRVATIALVHDTLSHGLDDTVDFTVVARRGMQAIVDVANRTENRVEGTLTGDFGVLRSEDATSVAMVLAELIQNAVEHGVDRSEGQLEVHAHRHAENGQADVTGALLTVRVLDHGPGLPSPFRPGSTGLGTRIVMSLIDDLRGSIEWQPGPHGGTQVLFTARLRPPGPAN